MADLPPLVRKDAVTTQLQSGTDNLDVLASYITATDDLTLEPGGTGALRGDSTGDARGADATDWQRVRAVSTEVASGDYSVIGGGENNTVDSSHSTVGGGLDNGIVTSDDATISGGNDNNMLNAGRSVIAGGINHTITSPSANGVRHSTISGGSTNTITSSLYATIGGGLSNDIDSSIGSTITGGRDNAIGTTCIYSSIAGGRNHDITTTATDCAIMGGDNNNIDTADRCTIVGGALNDITGVSTSSTVVGGQDNDIDTSAFCCIAGGDGNTIDTSSLYSTILGGQFNTITGATNGLIGGGSDNTVSAAYGSASGKSAVSAYYGLQAVASGHVTTIGDSQRFHATLRAQTTNATVTALTLDGGSGGLLMTDDTCWTVRALVVALLSDGAEGAGYELHGVFRKDGAAAAAVVGSVSQTVVGEDTAAWDAVLALSGSTVQVQVTGEAAHTINWHANVEIAHVAV